MLLREHKRGFSKRRHHQGVGDTLIILNSIDTVTKNRKASYYSTGEPVDLHLQKKKKDSYPKEKTRLLGSTLTGGEYANPLSLACGGYDELLAPNRKVSRGTFVRGERRCIGKGVVKETLLHLKGSFNDEKKVVSLAQFLAIDTCRFKEFLG